MNPFVFSFDYKDHFEEQSQNSKLSETERQRLTSFLATPKFVKSLTEISH
jgi:hypothetical protein